MTTVNNASNWLLALLMPQINITHLEDSCQIAGDVYKILLIDCSASINIIINI